MKRYLKKNLDDDGVFCVPSIPVGHSIGGGAVATAAKTTVGGKSAASPQAAVATLDYKRPEWSGLPPQPEQADAESSLDADGYSDHYFLEVIKNGSVVEKLKLLKEFNTFGRLPACDVLCEHPSLSRYHALLQYSVGSGDDKYPPGFYIYDLGSTHGSFVNKTRIEPLKYVKVEVSLFLSLSLLIHSLLLYLLFFLFCLFSFLLIY